MKLLFGDAMSIAFSLTLSLLITSFLSGVCIASKRAPQVNLRDHLCSKIKNSQFGAIDLLSISQYSDTVILFDTAHKYYIDTGRITQNVLPIPGLRFEWHKNELAQVWNGIDNYDDDLAHIKSVVIQQQTKDDLITVYLTTDKTEHTCKANLRTHTNAICEHSERIHSEYALVFGSSFGGLTRRDDDNDDSNVAGYMINQDCFQESSICSNEYVIYDHSWQFPNDVHKLYPHYTASEKEQSRFYYLQMTNDKPDEIVLVHRHNHLNKTGHSYPLFQSLPIGFKLDTTMYLFDRALRCVFLIEGMTFQLNDTFEQSQDNIHLTRKNIPFEKFFHCPPEYEFDDDFEQFYPPDRCDHAGNVRANKADTF